MEGLANSEDNDTSDSPLSLSGNRTRHRFTGWSLTFLLFLSGFAGISYEVLYGRMLGNIIGEQWLVSASILFTFLLGIGLGARYSHRLWRYLWLVEAGIGLYAAAFAVSVEWVETWLYAHSGGWGQTLAAKLVQCAVLLGPPAILIGASLPLFAGYLSRLRPELAFARAYTWHSFGAALTVLLVEFWLLRHLGLQGTVFTLALLNGLIAVVLRTVYGGVRDQVPTSGDDVKFPRYHLVALVLASIASAVFQLWLVKIAELTVGPFRETFALVLALVLVGIAIGTWLVRRFNFRLWHILAFNLVGLTWLIGAFETITGVYASLYPLALESVVTTLLLKMGFLTLLAGVPAVTFGAAIPALITTQNNVARESGQLLFISSLANAVGFLLMVFVLHQHLDYGSQIMAIALISSFGLLVFLRGHRIGATTAVGLLAAIAVLQHSLWNEQLLYLGYDNLQSSEKLKTAKSEVLQTDSFKGRQDVFALNTLDNGRIYLYINGYRSINLATPAEQIVGAFSSLFAPSTDRALVLGLGSGATAGTVGLLFDRVDTVEINGVLLNNLNRMGDLNFDVHNAANVHLIHDDGIHFVKAVDQSYSLIINTVTTPLYFSSSKLYTLDFLTSVKQHLAPNGVYVTWIDPRIGDRGMDITLKTLSQVFRQCGLGYIKAEYFLLLCSPGELAVRQPRLAMANGRLREFLLIEHQEMPEWLPYRVLNSNALDLIGDRSVSINTLDYPALEFEMARLQQRGFSEFMARVLTRMRIDDLQALLGPSMPWGPMLLGLVAEDTLGDKDITKRWKAALSERTPDFSRRYAQAKLNYYAQYAALADTAIGYYLYGYHLFNAGRFDRAIGQFERVLVLDPSYENANYYLGASYERMRRFELALAYYNKELSLNPENVYALMALGSVYIKTARSTEALQMLDRVLTIEPSADAQFFRGVAFRSLGDLSAARVALRGALALEPMHKRARRALEWLEQSGRGEE